MPKTENPDLELARLLDANDTSDPASAPEHQIQGAQSVRRALMLLRLVAKYRDEGVKLARLVRESALDRGTAWRLLSCMVEEGFIDRGSDNLYYLGPEAVLLNSLSFRPAALLSRFVPALQRVARISGDTTFLMMRQADHVYCMHREEGSSKVRVLTTNVGQRRAIGTGTGGTAVLGLMDNAEIKAIYERHQSEYMDLRMDLNSLFSKANDVRDRGFALTYDEFDEIGVAGVGIAFHISHHGMGAISLATLTARLGVERIETLRKLLANEVRSLGFATAGVSSGQY